MPTESPTLDMSYQTSVFGLNPLIEHADISMTPSLIRLAMILSISETEKIAKEFVQEKTRVSCWPLLFLIECSRSDDFASILDVINKLQYKTPTQYVNLIDPIKKYLEFRDLKPRRMCLKPAKQARLLGQFERVSVDSKEGQDALYLYHQSVEMMRHYNQSTPLLYLIEAAVCSGNRTLPDIQQYVALDFISPARFRRIIDNMRELGQIQSDL